jgi:hypothetical protein
MVRILDLSLNIKYDPIITNKGCSARMTMELATEVYTSDSIQNKKYRPRSRPARNTVLQSLESNFKYRIVFQGVKGSIIMADIYSLYIPAIAVGVSEDLIMIEEIDTDKMAINSNT